MLVGLAVVAGAPPAAAAGDAPELVVGRRDCQRLLRHEPRPDVEYRPGVDVRGRPVAPADLPGSPRIEVPKEIRIPLGVDLAEKYGIGDPGEIDATAPIGTVTVRGGRVFFDGKPIDGPDRAAVVDACRRAYGGQ